MTEEDFRAVYRGGVWWIEQQLDGMWKTTHGPYKYRKAAESRLRAEQNRKSTEEVK